MSKIKKIWIYIITFYLIYTPNLGNLFNLGVSINKYIVHTMGLIIVIPYIIKNKISLKSVKMLFTGIIVSSLYFFIMAFFNGYTSFKDLRIVQNNFVIIQFLYFIVLIDYLKKNNYDRDKIIRLFLNVAVIQCIFCILMIIFPSWKQIALRLYYGDNIKNNYLSVARLFGISEDYTFGTPIFNGLLCIISIIYAITKDKKYIFYTPFIAITSLLNGRTSLLLMSISIIVIYVILFIYNKITFKSIKVIITIMCIVIIVMTTISAFSPTTYSFLLEAVGELTAFFEEGEDIGTLKVLNNMTYWPDGINFVIGEGHRVYEVEGYSHSDVGYVNDMFMGGLVYCFILYGSILAYLLKNNKNADITHKLINWTMILFLFISNYKGECMKGGILICGIMAIKYVFIIFENEKEKKINEPISEHNNTSL